MHMPASCRCKGDIFRAIGLLAQMCRSAYTLSLQMPDPSLTEHHLGKGSARIALMLTTAIRQIIVDIH